MFPLYIRAIIRLARLLLRSRHDRKKKHALTARKLPFTAYLFSVLDFSYDSNDSNRLVPLSYLSGRVILACK